MVGGSWSSSCRKAQLWFNKYRQEDDHSVSTAFCTWWQLQDKFWGTWWCHTSYLPMHHWLNEWGKTMSGYLDCSCSDAYFEFGSVLSVIPVALVKQVHNQACCCSNSRMSVLQSLPCQSPNYWVYKFNAFFSLQVLIWPFTLLKFQRGVTVCISLRGFASPPSNHNNRLCSSIYSKTLSATDA